MCPNYILLLNTSTNSLIFVVLPIMNWSTRVIRKWPCTHIGFVWIVFSRPINNNCHLSNVTLKQQVNVLLNTISKNCNNDAPSKTIKHCIAFYVLNYYRGLIIYFYRILQNTLLATCYRSTITLGANAFFKVEKKFLHNLSG